ncbi:MAG TPA: HPr family phosphocarrier protein [Symbiobacteriaceae bacterium]|nr:HPr family phosphocarrier protein [Symbiobacteriaceae bacterium]
MERTVVIGHREGLHARPAAEFGCCRDKQAACRL